VRLSLPNSNVYSSRSFTMVIQIFFRISFLALALTFLFSTPFPLPLTHKSTFFLAHTFFLNNVLSLFPAPLRSLSWHLCYPFLSCIQIEFFLVFPPGQGSNGTVAVIPYSFMRPFPYSPSFFFLFSTTLKSPSTGLLSPSGDPPSCLRP